VKDSISGMKAQIGILPLYLIFLLFIFLFELKSKKLKHYQLFI